jgi:predicted RNA-binding Zn ribbon-like protein
VDNNLMAPKADLAQTDLDLVRAVREALRAMLVHNAGGPPPNKSAWAVLRTLAENGSARADLGDDGEIRLAAQGESLRDRLLEVLLIIRDAQRDGSWARLKACANDECQWAFYDRARNHGGTWCDMATCGNKLKNREFRARRKAASR